MSAITIVAHDVDAFEEQVSAYPAITIIRAARQGAALVADTTSRFDEASAVQLREWLGRGAKRPLHASGISAARLPHWFGGEDSWPAGSPDRLALLEYLNDNFEPLENRALGTRIGIGVATGADQVFITKDDLDVESDRLLPLAMGRDTTTGTLTWSGHHLVNPWGPDGRLVALAEYPRLTRYLESQMAIVKGRNVASKKPDQWYRTIDKVDDSLTPQAKLLFPDMKMTSHPVYESGGLYPHHGLYFVVSEEWDLQVLGGLLLSKVAEFFIDCYAVKMRGGTMRFQAQYLRRIRVPKPGDIAPVDAVALAAAFAARDVDAATEVAYRMYGIDGIPT